MRYAVVIEKGDGNYGAWVRDLPSVAAVGATLEEVQALIEEAIELHVAGLREQGKSIPRPSHE